MYQQQNQSLETPHLVQQQQQQQQQQVQEESYQEPHDAVVEESYRWESSGQISHRMNRGARTAKNAIVALALAKLVKTIVGERVLNTTRKAILLLRLIIAKIASSGKYIGGAAIIGAAIWIRKIRDQNRNIKKAKRVAIVGSGVAGSGAAWSLNKSGIDVVVYEKKPKVGGNAKAFSWKVETEDGQVENVETGIAVLAYPKEYFHNYNAFIQDKNIETEDHDTRFFISERDENGNTKCVFAHGKEQDSADGKQWEPEKWLKEDLKKWDSLVQFVCKTNKFFTPSSDSSDDPSLYRFSFFNPLNVIPLRTLALRIYGISERFWQYVFVPIHSSTFLEVDMDQVPSCMAEVLDGIIPFTKVPKLECWKTTGYDTITRMLEHVPKDNIRTSCGVESVQFLPRKNSEEGYDVKVIDEDGVEEIYDSVVFACSSKAMNRILHGKGDVLPGQEIIANPANGFNNVSFSLKSKVLNWLESFLLSMTIYTTDRDKTFEQGMVHSDADAVLPKSHREEVLKSYCNYIEVDKTNPLNLENSFVISSWSPPALKPNVRGRLPMLVSYNTQEKLENSEVEWTSTSREAHPCLTTFQLISSVLLWPFLQGSRNSQAYFCGSAVLGGNGHDLSFLSGLLVAERLGAPYPFPHHPKAHADYERLKSMMFNFV